jgi:S1-C subfamily serine protease
VQRSLAAALLLGVCSGQGLHAADPAPRLTPVETAGRTGERVDPMRPVRLTAEERDRLYEQAARDAEPLERQAMQLRRLASLLRPTVVHIDATKRLLRPRGGRTTEDEAGSGVIIEVGGRTVVITNRHVVHGADLEAIAIRLDDGREIHPRRIWPTRSRSESSRPRAAGISNSARERSASRTSSRPTPPSIPATVADRW